MQRADFHHAGQQRQDAIYADASKHLMPRRQSARNSYCDTQARIYVTHIRFHGCHYSFNVINVPQAKEFVRPL